MELLKQNRNKTKTSTNLNYNQMLNLFFNMKFILLEH